MTKIVREIKKFGDSLVIVLGRKVIRELELKEGDALSIELEKINLVNKITIKCKYCDYHFDDDEGKDCYDCPSCQNEIDKDDIIIIKE